MDPRHTLGRAIRERRVVRGLSQEALGEVAGLHRTYIGDIEQGRRNVSLLNICRIAGALDCQPAELLAEVKAIQPEQG